MLKTALLVLTLTDDGATRVTLSEQAGTEDCALARTTLPSFSPGRAGPTRRGLRRDGPAAQPVRARRRAGNRGQPLWGGASCIRRLHRRGAGRGRNLHAGARGHAGGPLRPLGARGTFDPRPDPGHLLSRRKDRALRRSARVPRPDARPGPPRSAGRSARPRRASAHGSSPGPPARGGRGAGRARAAPRPP